MRPFRRPLEPRGAGTGTDLPTRSCPFEQVSPNGRDPDPATSGAPLSEWSDWQLRGPLRRGDWVSIGAVGHRFRRNEERFVFSSLRHGSKLGEQTTASMVGDSVEPVGAWI